MALNYTRLICGRNLNVKSFRGFYTGKNLAVSTSNIASDKVALHENHDEKNMRLKRPMSPHLTIYQVQITSLLSVSHRATGMILSSYAAVIGLSTIFMPGGVPCLIESVYALCLPAAAIFVGKIALAFPVAFHFWNGIRHLAWDLGLFLTIKAVYATGYAVVLSAAVMSVFLATL